MKKFRKFIGQKGFTLPEAMFATFILAVGIVGLQTAMSRGLVSAVRAWDREVKTNIAMSRLEEHKAQVFSSFQPGMVLPVLLPTPIAGATPVNFANGAITYTSTTRVSIDATSNSVSVSSGYGVVYPTPGFDNNYFYGDVNPNASPTPNQIWGDYKRVDPCDTTSGNMYFNITTPNNVRGLLTFNVVDRKGLQRQEKIWVNGAVTALTVGNISTTTPTPVTFPITNLDTSSGLLSIHIQQTGGIDDWGNEIEDGATNASLFTIQATSTTSPTPFPSKPTPIAKSNFGINYGTPVPSNFGCDTSPNALLANGRAPGKVTWTSGALSMRLDAPGKVFAGLYWMNSMSVTMRVIATPNPGAGAGAATLIGGAASRGWTQIGTASNLAQGTTITQIIFDFVGTTAAVTNYLGIDSVRTVYDNALNPNAVLDSMTLGVLDSYVDTTTYKDYVVQSLIQPMTAAGAASGYDIQVIVHNAKNGVITDTFAPVTVTNSVSP